MLIAFFIATSLIEFENRSSKLVVQSPTFRWLCYVTTQAKACTLNCLNQARKFCQNSARVSMPVCRESQRPIERGSVRQSLYVSVSSAGEWFAVQPSVGRGRALTGP